MTLHQRRRASTRLIRRPLGLLDPGRTCCRLIPSSSGALSGQLLVGYYPASNTPLASREAPHRNAALRYVDGSAEGF